MSEEKQGTMIVVGRVVEVGPLVEVGARRHPKRSIVIAINERANYPGNLEIEFFGKNSDKAERVAVGDVVKVDVEVTSRKGNGRWYTAAAGWRLRVVEESTPSTNRGAPAPNGGGWGNAPDGEIPF